MKGSYVLLIELVEDKQIVVGKLGCLYLPKGFYAYVGSAMNGLVARVERHLRKEKKLRWHIDYFLKSARIEDIILCPSEQKVECLLAQALAERLCFISGFGSSDCKCRSHLYFADDKGKLEASVGEAVRKAGSAPIVSRSRR